MSLSSSSTIALASFEWSGSAAADTCVTQSGKGGVDAPAGPQATNDTTRKTEIVQSLIGYFPEGTAAVVGATPAFNTTCTWSSALVF